MGWWRRRHGHRTQFRRKSIRRRNAELDHFSIPPIIPLQCSNKQETKKTRKKEAEEEGIIIKKNIYIYEQQRKLAWSYRDVALREEKLVGWLAACWVCLRLCGTRWKMCFVICVCFWFGMSKLELRPTTDDEAPRPNRTSFHRQRENRSQKMENQLKHEYHNE